MVEGSGMGDMASRIWNPLSLLKTLPVAPEVILNPNVLPRSKGDRPKNVTYSAPAVPGSVAVPLGVPNTPLTDVPPA